MTTYLEDLREGSEYLSAARTIRKEDITAFAELSGDFSPLHTDDEMGAEEHALPQPDCPWRPDLQHLPRAAYAGHRRHRRHRLPGVRAHPGWPRLPRRHHHRAVDRVPGSPVAVQPGPRHRLPAGRRRQPGRDHRAARLRHLPRSRHALGSHPSAALCVEVSSVDVGCVALVRETGRRDRSGLPDVLRRSCRRRVTGRPAGAAGPATRKRTTAEAAARRRAGERFPRVQRHQWDRRGGSPLSGREPGSPS